MTKRRKAPMTETTDWSKPIAVTDIEMVFPADVRHLMPSWDEIPDEFKHRDTEWNKIQSSWFFSGLPADVEFYLKDGVDGEAMLRHIQAVQGSFQPKHEHKEAAVAYLLSLWCDDIKKWKKAT